MTTGNREGTDRAGWAEVLSELLAGLKRRQGTGSAAIVGERLHVDWGCAGVEDRGLLSNGRSAEEGGGGGDEAELHDGRQLGLKKRWFFGAGFDT